MWSLDSEGRLWTELVAVMLHHIQTFPSRSSSCRMQSALLLWTWESNRGRHPQADPGEQHCRPSSTSAQHFMRRRPIYQCLIFTDGQQNGQNLAGLQKSPDGRSFLEACCQGEEKWTHRLRERALVGASLEQTETWCFEEKMLCFLPL